MRRLEKRKPIVDDLRNFLDEQRQRVLPRTPLGRALGYLHRQWHRLLLFLDGGNIEVTNNGSNESFNDWCSVVRVGFSPGSTRVVSAQPRSSPRALRTRSTRVPIYTSSPAPSPMARRRHAYASCSPTASRTRRSPSAHNVAPRFRTAPPSRRVRWKGYPEPRSAGHAFGRDSRFITPLPVVTGSSPLTPSAPTPFPEEDTYAIPRARLPFGLADLPPQSSSAPARSRAALLRVGCAGRI